MTTTPHATMRSGETDTDQSARGVLANSLNVVKVERLSSLRRAFGVLPVSHLFVFFYCFQVFMEIIRGRVLYAITCVGDTPNGLRSIFRARRYPLFLPTPTTPVVSEGNCARPRTAARHISCLDNKSQNAKANLQHAGGRGPPVAFSFSAHVTKET